MLEKSIAACVPRGVTCLAPSDSQLPAVAIKDDLNEEITERIRR
jgi:hypothetical protein